jgi:hypothetical protein
VTASAGGPWVPPKAKVIKLPSGIDSGEGVALEMHEDEDAGTGTGTWWIVATNQGGFDCTMVNLGELLGWLRMNRPDLLEDPARGE